MDVPTIVCIGKATQDVFLKSASAFSPKMRDGILYEELPLGSKLDVDDVIFATGGNVTNAAVTFARQGLHSVYVWSLGKDISSEMVLQDLDKEGVNTTGVSQHDDFRTSYSTVLLANTGERTILNFHGTVPPSDGDYLNLDMLKGADWLYLSALGDITLLDKVISFAHANGVKVMLNPATAELAEPDKLKPLLEEIEVLVVNKEEAMKLVSGQTIEELARHGTNFCPVVIVSDGPNGAVATDKKTVVTAGMYEDVPVIDRTGGGDAFGSGFLSQYAIGKSLKDSMIFASANSTSVVTQIGAKAGILHKGTVLHDMPITEGAF